jgi:hypothetical protein
MVRSYWAQAMIAHVWGNYEHLTLYPAPGTDEA